MTLKNKQKIYDLVKVICGTTIVLPQVITQIPDATPDCPTKDTWKAAKELLNTVGVTENAKIIEIPLCWSEQVCIRFTLGNPDIIFDLSAGVSCKDKSDFFFLLQIENDFGTFPIPSDDDIGICLFNDSWRIENKKIVE